MNKVVPAALSLALLVGCDRSSKPPPPSGAPSSSPPVPTPVASVTASASAPLVASANASAMPPSPERGPALAIRFDGETAGAPPKDLEPVVGDWAIAKGGDGGADLALAVDGSKWRNGTPSANLADQARRLYGDSSAEFLDGVKAFALFPLAIVKSQPPPGDVRISVRFRPLAGKIDQAAGIAFAIAPDGSYLGVRANALEDNVLFFKVVKGKRTVLETVRDVPTPSRAWHTLAVELHGVNMTVEVDGKQRLEHALDALPAGRVGLWSKADSQVLFDDFEVRPL